VLARTRVHFFPKWGRWLERLRDARDASRIIYPASFLVWTGVLIFLLKLGARRRLGFACAGPRMLDNLNRLSENRMERVEHHDTLAYFLGRLPQGELPWLRRQMIQRLIRMKCLDRFRLRGCFLVAVDATGMLSFQGRHCDHCLTRESRDRTVYYHMVLEAKLVASNGLALSLATEFVENPGHREARQDCELKAFYRLARRLKEDYPQLTLCLLLDGLYACEGVLKVCREMGWRYLISFKEGSAPQRWGEYQALRGLTAENRRRAWGRGGVVQDFAWVQGLSFGEETTDVLECREKTGPGGVKTFVWISNFPLSAEAVVELANRGGRLRWIIENQGFNEQKNGGYALEHAYSHSWPTAKNFYYLLQIAHILAQLVEKGSLLKHVADRNLSEAWGGVRSLAHYLWESLRHWEIPRETLDPRVAEPIQIRLNSS
jgi:hypothetical protein